MTEKELERLDELSLPIAGNVLYLELTKEFVELFCKAMEELEASAKSEKESEEKSMLHNVTVKREENKVLEEFWVMRAVKEGKLPFDFKKAVIDERKLDHEPSKSEIAQFLSDNGADFVSVVQNYRFVSEFPFC